MLTELAILIAARQYTINPEWNAHSANAVKARLDPAIIAAIAEGRRPDTMNEEEAIVYDFCTELRPESKCERPYLRTGAGDVW